MPKLYLIIDAVLAVLVALALWSLLRLGRWEQRMRQQHQAGRLRLLRIGLRLIWDVGMPVTLLVGARLLLHALGALSWAEGLLLFPDLGVWLWAIALVMLLTGALRLGLLLRVLRRADGQRGIAASAGITSRRST